jgi:hypothetical protein
MRRRLTILAISAILAFAFVATTLTLWHKMVVAVYGATQTKIRNDVIRLVKPR